MAELTNDPRLRIMLVTANVGSLFEDPEQLQKAWLREFFSKVEILRPHFLALHCQEVGGKNYEASMSHVEIFIKALLSSDAMRGYNTARIYVDENYKSQEHFTALGSFYFIHESLKNVQQFDFKAETFVTVVGKEMRSEPVEHNPFVEKEKFPIDYHPELKWSRKGFIRTRWALGDCVFDLVNIHLFHDACNLLAWERSPSMYSICRQRALRYVLDRITNLPYDQFSTVHPPFFIFGDFNFRLDSRQVFKRKLCPSVIPEALRTGEDKQLVKLTFRKRGNDPEIILQVEKKRFDYVNQHIFRKDNGTSLLEFDKELETFKETLNELEITFPPSYPYSEEIDQGSQYMNTRLPAWCDRILMSPSAKELVTEFHFREDSIVYDTIGPKVCMGDHKPVYLSFEITTPKGKC